MRVLVADDNVDAANTLAEVLRLSGHEVRTAYDGRAAVTVAHAWKPRAVILDFNMPYMNGSEVARLLKKDFQDIVIIGTSAMEPASIRLSGHASFLDVFMVKPCDLNRLTTLLSSLALQTKLQPS